MLHARHLLDPGAQRVTITGLGDHDQPDWLITMNGIRNFLNHRTGRPVLRPRRPPLRLITPVHCRYRWCAYSRVGAASTRWSVSPVKPWPVLRRKEVARTCMGR